MRLHDQDFSPVCHSNLQENSFFLENYELDEKAAGDGVPVELIEQLYSERAHSCSVRSGSPVITVIIIAIIMMIVTVAVAY